MDNEPAPAFKLAVSKYSLDKKIPAGDPFWSKFNASFDNVVLPADMMMQAVYDGHAITTQHKDHWRTSANYLCGQYIGLDFDNGDQTSSIPYLMKDKFVWRYASFLYTTMSHTPEEPRSRIIFTLDQPIMQAKNYTLATAALLWLFGTADRACKDPVRFFYGSPRCECEYLDNVLPLEVLKKLIAEYQETGNTERRKASNYSAPASQQEVSDALAKIPAWGIEYDEWVQVLMGIHAEFGEAGLGLAENWAQGGKGEVQRKWKSFKAQGNTSGAVSIGTVFGIAKKFGWSKVNAQV